MTNDTATILDGLLFIAANEWQMDEEQILDNMAMIEYHESKGDPTAIQKVSKGTEVSIIPSFLGEGAIATGTEYGEGRGKGLFQFESNVEGGGQGGAQTAITRLTNLLESQGAVVPDWISELSENEYDVSGLSPEQQQIIFLGNLLEKKNVEGRVPSSFKDVKTLEDVAKYWAQHHQAGTTPDSTEEEKMMNRFKKDVSYGEALGELDLFGEI